MLDGEGRWPFQIDALDGELRPSQTSAAKRRGPHGDGVSGAATGTNHRRDQGRPHRRRVGGSAKAVGPQRVAGDRKPTLPPACHRVKSVSTSQLGRTFAGSENCLGVGRLNGIEKFESGCHGPSSWYQLSRNGGGGGVTNGGETALQKFFDHNGLGGSGQGQRKNIRTRLTHRPSAPISTSLDGDFAAEDQTGSESAPPGIGL
jgi:hypothetical protein